MIAATAAKAHQQQQQTTTTTTAASATTNSTTNEEVINPVKVYAWFTSVASLCKTIWLMAVAQHQFHLDKKQNKGNILQYKSLNDLALELCNNNTMCYYNQEIQLVNGLPTAGGSEKNNLLDYLTERNNLDYRQDLLTLFKKRREVLQRRMAMKKSELEEINYKTEEIAELSKSLSSGGGKDQLNHLNRVLIDFENILAKRKLIFINELEIEYSLQREIMLTTLGLASDININSPVIAKKRRDLYEKEKKKVKF
jgi:hypothetical protein